MRSQSNNEKKQYIYSSPILDNPMSTKQNIQKNILSRFSSQQELQYYVEKKIGNDKVIPILQSQQNLSLCNLDDDNTEPSTNKQKQKIIYLQRDMIQYAPESMKQKTSQLLKNNLKKTSNYFETKDEDKYIHFNRGIHMPFANIFPNSSQKLSKLIGYQPQKDVSVNMADFRYALQQRSIKALTNKNNIKNDGNYKKIQPFIGGDPMKKFDTFFTTKLEYHQKEQYSQLSAQKKKFFKEDNIQQQQQQQRRSDIFQKEEKSSKFKLFRNIIIIHLNPYKQNAIELLSYRIPYYNDAEQILKDSFISNQKLLDNLLSYCSEYFSLNYQLKFLSLLDETPIQQLQDIPHDQNLVIISNNPKDNFWSKYFDQVQIQKPNERELQHLISKLNNMTDLSQIENYFRNKRSFITGLEDSSLQSSTIFNSNQQSRQLTTQTPLIQGKKSSITNEDNQLSQNELRPSLIDYQQTLSTQSPNKTSQQLIFNSQNSIQTPLKNMYRGSFISPFKSKQPNTYNRLESFATPQKSHPEISNSLPQINLEDSRYIKKGNSRMRIYNEPKKLRENIIQTQQTQNQNKTQKQKLKSTVQKNIDKYTSLDIELQKKYNLLNDAANVGTILKKTSFNRYQLHLLFSKFKALIDYKAKFRNPLKKSPKLLIEEGVDVISFRRGVDSLLVAPTEQIEKIFQSQNAFVSKDQGGMNWEGFVYALDMIEAKTDNAKIDLFMRLLDENQNGTISYDEIFEQSNQLLRQLYKSDQNEGISVDDISHFLTKTIFDAVGQDYDQEILSEDLKIQIRKKNKDLELLLMLCFYNNEQPHNYYSNSDEEDYMEEEKRLKAIYS